MSQSRSESGSTGAGSHYSGDSRSKRSCSCSQCNSDSASLDTSSTSSSDFLSEVSLQAHVIDPFPDKWDESNQLGKGAHATAHKAKMGDIDVAVKVIQLIKRNNKEDCDYELKTMAFLMPHAEPYMVKFIGHYYNDGTNPTTCTIALEYMNNGSLEDWISNPTTTLFLTQADRQTGLCHLAEGLACLHGHGVLHGDIKPANILIKNQVLKYADFGLSMPTDTKSKFIGSPYFMALEVLNRTAPISKASDIFSFCVLIVAMINKISITSYYEDIEKIKSLSELITFHKDGKRPPIPNDKNVCPTKLAKQLTLGFMKDAYRRPEAIDFVDCFKEIEEEILLAEIRLTEGRQAEGRSPGVRVGRKFHD